MGLRKEIKEIKEDVKNIKENLTSDIIQKAKKYDELKELLEEIYFDIELIESFDYNGETQYEIIYKNPKVMLNFDEYGEPIKNNFFYSINMLNLLTKEANDTLYEVLRKEKIKKVNNWLDKDYFSK